MSHILYYILDLKYVKWNHPKEIFKAVGQGNEMLVG